MKQLLLMRHANSEWAGKGVKDFDRSLDKRGLEDAPMMGRFMRESGYKPNIVISSPAKRAKETTKLSMNEAQVAEESILWNKKLYHGSVKDYMIAMQEVSEEYHRILMIGHNPMMEVTTGILAGVENGTGFRMPTSALVCMECMVNKWEQLSPGTCRINWMMIPEVLRKIEARF